jgi:hypothetical protein
MRGRMLRQHAQSLRRGAIAVARQRAFELRRDDIIGDDAYRVLVQELDWAELSAGGGRHD